MVRSWLHRNGFRFRLHRKDLPGKPDIVLPQYRTAILVHGCFWHTHGCKNSVLPSTRREFWQRKLKATVRRDKEVALQLAAKGWNVLVLWECQVSLSGDGLSKLASTIRRGK